MKRTHAIGVTILALLACATPSAGQTTGHIGSATAGEGPWELTCPGMTVLIGIEVRYGYTGAGRTRGTCREIGWDGVWSGSSSVTDWSWNNSSAEIAQQTNRNCASGQVVAGFAGSTSGPNIHSLRIVCADIAGDTPSGSGTLSAAAGSSGGTQSQNHVCPAGTVARGFQLRARSILHFYRMVCGELPTVAAPTSIVSVNGFEFYQQALSAGWTFQAVNGNGQPDGRCDFYVQRNRVQMENAPTALGKTCRFSLFEGGTLENGWTIRGVSLDHRDNDCRSGTRIVGLDEGSGDPSFDVLVDRPRGQAAMLCIPVLRSVRLEGPSNTSWQSAIR